MGHGTPTVRAKTDGIDKFLVQIMLLLFLQIMLISKLSAEIVHIIN